MENREASATEIGHAGGRGMENREEMGESEIGHDEGGGINISRSEMKKNFSFRSLNRYFAVILDKLRCISEIKINSLFCISLVLM